MRPENGYMIFEPSEVAAGLPETAPVSEAANILDIVRTRAKENAEIAREKQMSPLMADKGQVLDYALEASVLRNTAKDIIGLIMENTSANIDAEVKKILGDPDDTK